MLILFAKTFSNKKCSKSKIQIISCISKFLVLSMILLPCSSKCKNSDIYVILIMFQPSYNEIQNKMSLTQQANHLKLLYEKKFYLQSPQRQDTKNSIPIKHKLPQFFEQDKNKPKQLISSENRKRGHTIDFNASVRLNKVYDFEYYNQRQQKHLISYRNFALKRQNPRSRSVIGNKSVLLKKNDNWIEEIIAGSQKTKQKYFLSILKQSKIKAMNATSICNDLSSKMLRNNVVQKQKKKKDKNSTRLTISELKKKGSTPTWNSKIEQKKKEKDENQLLPWDTQMNQF